MQGNHSTEGTSSCHLLQKQNIKAHKKSNAPPGNNEGFGEAIGTPVWASAAVQKNTTSHKCTPAQFLCLCSWCHSDLIRLNPKLSFLANLLSPILDSLCLTTLFHNQLSAYWFIPQIFFSNSLIHSELWVCRICCLPDSYKKPTPCTATHSYSSSLATPFPALQPLPFSPAAQFPIPVTLPVIGPTSSVYASLPRP